MVLNLFRLSNDLGSNLSVELLIFFVHKNPVGGLLSLFRSTAAYLSFSVSRTLEAALKL